MNDPDNISLKDISTLIEGLKYDKEKYEEKRESIRLSVQVKAVVPKQDIVQSSFCNDKMVDYVICIEEIDKRIASIEEQINELQEAKDSMIRLIKQENELIYRVVYMKEKGSSLKEISEGTGYSVSTIRRLLKEYYESSRKF